MSRTRLSSRRKGGRPDGRQSRRTHADETDEWLDALDFGRGFRGHRPGRRDPRRGRHLRAAQGRAAAVRRQHRLRQHDPAGGPAAPSGRPQDRAANPPLRPLERRGDRGQGEQGILRARRPYRELPVGRDALRHRLHAFLARRQRRSTAATSSISRATARPASTRAPSSRGGSPRTSSSTSARRSAARACRPIRIPG